LDCRCEGAMKEKQQFELLAELRSKQLQNEK
jgi:hypothetical protein